MPIDSEGRDTAAARAPSTPPAAWDEWALLKARELTPDLGPIGGQTRHRAAIQCALIEAMRFAAPPADRAEPAALLTVAREDDPVWRGMNFIGLTAHGKTLAAGRYHLFAAVAKDSLPAPATSTPCASGEAKLMSDEQVADAIESEFSRTGEWPEGDVQVAHAVQRALAATQAPAATFQARVAPWLTACFGETIARDAWERNRHFLEEALELVQACGYTAAEAHQEVDRVFSQPLGEPSKEVGNVMTTLAALCLAHGIDMHAAGEADLAHVSTHVESIRARQLAKSGRTQAPAVPASGERAWVYRLNLLESCANWLESRSYAQVLRIPNDPIEGGGYASLMRGYAQDLRTIREFLARTPTAGNTEDARRMGATFTLDEDELRQLLMWHVGRHAHWLGRADNLKELQTGAEHEQETRGEADRHHARAEALRAALTQAASTGGES